MTTEEREITIDIFNTETDYNYSESDSEEEIPEAYCNACDKSVESPSKHLKSDEHKHRMSKLFKKYKALTDADDLDECVCSKVKKNLERRCFCMLIGDLCDICDSLMMTPDMAWCGHCLNGIDDHYRELAEMEHDRSRYEY